MAITINSDKLRIFEIITSDPYITEQLGFVNKNIFRTRTTTDKISSTAKQLFIYNVTPENTASAIVTGIVYQIDISTPLAEYNDADLCAEQLVALLGDCDLSEFHHLKLLDPPLTLTASPSNYCIGIRFVCNSTIYNKPKQLTKK